MQYRNPFLRSSALGVVVILATSLVSVNVQAFAQSKTGTVPDAQIEANVLKALAGSPQLANQSITSTTAFGVVTLGGTVQDDASRDLADKLVSTTAGVQKVLDQMTVGTAAPATSANNGAAQPGESNPNLQSDGTVAPPQEQSAPPPSSGDAGAPPQQSGQYPPAYPQQSYPPAQQPYPQSQQPYPQTQQSYPQSQQPYPYPQTQQSYPQPYPQTQQPYPQPYPQTQQPYPQTRQPYPQPYPQRPYVAQRGGDSVVVPAGSVLRVRINQGMDSKRTAVGTVFDGVVLSDVFAGGSIAIPRGATVKGTVIESHPAGDFAGKGELKLQLTEVLLGGQVYPIVTDFWWHQGANKTGNTVGNTVGLGAMGALIGGVAGGGVGAAVGAGVGGVAGLGVSAASHQGEAGLPPESIVSFHLTQPADITTVSQAELNRLGAGVPISPQPQMMRRYAYPPPYPPPYYGPTYYRAY